MLFSVLFSFHLLISESQWKTFTKKTHKPNNPCVLMITKLLFSRNCTLCRELILQNPERKDKSMLSNNNQVFFSLTENLKVLVPAGDILTGTLLTFPELSETDIKAELYTLPLFWYLNLTAKLPLLLFWELLLCYDLTSTNFSN